MAVWSSVKLSEMYGAFRWDAECYTPRMLRDQHALAGLTTIKLGSIAFVTDGQHGYHEVDEESEVRHLTAKSVRAGVVIDRDVDRLAMATHEANPASSLEADDVLLSTAGTIGNAGVVTKHVLPANIDQDVARIKVSKSSRVHPYFVAAFLRSEFGQFQCERATTGQIQGHINLAALRDFDIPILPQQSRVAKTVRRGLSAFWGATTALQKAEHVLLAALGLNALDLTPSLCYSRPFKDLLAARRFDAEYFNPRHQRVLKRLTESGQTIGSVAELAERRFIPGQTHKGPTIRYIEIGSLTGDGQAEAETIDLTDAPSRARYIVEPGDIITSTVRPIRRLSALIGKDQKGHVCSSGFAVLRPKKDRAGIEPEVLLTYLRLPVICEIMDLHCTASMYPAIPVVRLLSIPIALPKPSVRAKIVEQVRVSIAARQKSARLLDDAKRMVEEMVLGKAHRKGK